MSWLNSIGLRDEINLSSESNSSSGNGRPLLIYFLPGNPGCVEYYHNFLLDLQSHLPRDKNIAIFGATYDGFELHESTASKRIAIHGPPYHLYEVVEGAQRKLSQKAREFEQPVDVVLIGHSVGSYILLQVLTWWQSQKGERDAYTIVGGVGLFPTLTEIAKSPKGKIFSWILLIPFISLLAHFAARLLSFVPTWLFDWPKAFTPGERMTEHVAVTEAVLRSRSGARQAAFMAADEMHDLAHDKWHPANIWGVVEHEHSAGKDTSRLEVQTAAGLPRTKLFFYWGEDDYWIDNKIRDAFIAKRAHRPDDQKTRHWPKMVMDEHRMDHCFSLTAAHSKLVAAQVAEWIREIRVL